MAPGGLSHVHAGGNSALLGPQRYEASLKASIFTLQALLTGHPVFVVLKDEPLPAVPCKAVLDPGGAPSSPTYSVTSLGKENSSCKRTCFTCSPAVLGADTRGISSTHTASAEPPAGGWAQWHRGDNRRSSLFQAELPSLSKWDSPLLQQRTRACLPRE